MQYINCRIDIWIEAIQIWVWTSKYPVEGLPKQNSNHEADKQVNTKTQPSSGFEYLPYFPKKLTENMQHVLLLILKTHVFRFCCIYSDYL